MNFRNPHDKIFQLNLNFILAVFKVQLLDISKSVKNKLRIGMLKRQLILFRVKLHV